MAKRRASSTYDLTGGTGDVNPQLLTCFVTQSGTDNTTEVQVPLPVARGQAAAQGNRATVIEILKIFWDTNHVFSTSAGTYIIFAGLSTKSTINSVPTNSTQLSYWQYKASSAFISYVENAAVTVGAPTTLVSNTYTDPVELDYTDAAGHGVLVATDNLYLISVSAATATGGSNTGVTNRAHLKILYRFKEVTLQEYIGIVQSQQ